MKRLRLSRLTGAATVFSVLAATALAQGPTVTGDTYIQSGANAGQNFGALANVLVGPGTGATQNQGLIRFDLSGLTGVTPADVQKAVVWVYVNRVTTAGSIDVYDVTSSWSEGAVTWNTVPTTGSNQGTIAVPSAGQWVGLDITSLVQYWIQNPSLNYGVALRASTAPNTAVTLDAKESTATSHPAQLQIVLSGPAGATGPAGAAGPTGATGAAGAAGATGPAGDTGPAGATGPAGPTGTAGAAGATGAAGAPGAAGATGPAGAAGPTGATGVQGLTGAAGATGPAGATGANGSTVLNGAGAPSSGSGVDGDFYLRTDTTCLYGPKASGVWPGSCTTLIGPAGATGATGSAGAAGATGATGVAGAAGATGPAGATGTAGAAGATGATGPQGLTGAAGATGPSGPSGAAGAGMWLMTGITPGNTNPWWTGVMGSNTASGGGNNTINAGPAGNPVPIACTINLMYVTATCGSTCTGTDAVTATIVKNGADTGMTCTATSNTTQNSIVTSSACTANAVALAAGDSVALKWTHTNSTPVVRFGSGIRCQ